MTAESLALIPADGQKWDARLLLERLRRHYIKPGPFPGYVFLDECGINGSTGRRVDAVAVGFTSTSGRLLVGHELKVSRADWRHELDQSGKADVWADNCHAWYVVAPSTDIVPVEEVPHGWGLMIPSPRTKTRMQVVVKAQVHAARTPSWRIVRSIMARLDTLQAAQIQHVRATAREDVRKQVLEEQARDDERRGKRQLTHQEQKSLHHLERLEEALGRPLDDYAWGEDGRVDPQRLAAALRVLQSFESMLGRRGTESTVTHMEGAARAVLAGLEEFGHAAADLRALVDQEAAT